MFNRRQLRFHSLLFFKQDLPAGLTVFFVALPLCLGIALASGAPLEAGILSGIIGGLVVSLLSGSALGVSGPAAGLTTMVALVLTTYNNYPAFMAIIIGAGLFQLVLGVLRLGAIANYFPSAVIKGMLAAIGIILISKQLPVAIGYGHPDFWSKEFINLISDTHLFTNIQEFYSNLSLGALLITILSLTAYFIWEKPWFDKMRFIPVPLFVVLTSISLQIIFTHFVPFLALNETQLVKIPDHLFTSFQSPDFSIFKTFDAIKYALVIGTLATLETLLCVEAIDKLDPWHRTTPTNRELMAQGAGNMLCGFFGALPMTAVIVRGSANIDAGGRTWKASFTHGACMLLAVILIPVVINHIPLCALASILIVTGFKLTKPKLYRSMFKLGWNQFLPFIITVVVILFTDLLIGVSIGLLLSAIFIIRNNYVADYDMQQETHLGITTYTINLHTNVTFLDKSKLKTVLAKIPDYSRVVIDGSFAKHIDHDVLETVSEFIENAKRKGIEVELKQVQRVSLTDIH
jgi:MFS superfamily sulfate permease-like transporter